MVVAEIYISQGIDDHRFIIDGETVSENSPMTGFRHKPFETWKQYLIRELIEECNRDFFILKISASSSQFEYVSKLAEECGLCKECIHMNAEKKQALVSVDQAFTDVSDNAWERMDFLFQQYGNKLAQIRKLTFGLIIPEQFAGEYVQIIDSLVDIGFSKSSLKIKRGYFNISLEEIDEDDIDYIENDVFSYQIDNDSKKVITLKSEPNSVGEQILSYIEHKYVIPFLDGVREQLITKDEKETARHADVENLDCTISLPEKMDKGSSAQIVVIGASKDQLLDQLQCEIDNPNVIAYADGKLTALRAGQTTIKFRLIGKLEYISKHQVSVIEHIVVDSIKLSQSSFDGLVNDQFKLTATCYPESAENIEELKFESLTPNVVQINQNGEIRTLSDGIGKVRAYIGEVEAIASIRVGSRIREIKTSRENLNLFLGETEKIKIDIDPATYSENSINVRSQNADIAIYKNGMIIAKGIGETDIVFSSKNSSATSKTHVKVNSTFEKRNYTGIPVQIGIALFILALFYSFVLQKSSYGMRFSSCGFILCLFSVFIDKKDRFFSVVFALLNAIVFYLLFR